jgi:uncharacterized protein YajQ (UPF0234 family)
VTDAYAKEIIVALTQLTRLVANIDASLKNLTKLVRDDGLKVETGIHEKLAKITQPK